MSGKNIELSGSKSIPIIIQSEGALMQELSLTSQIMMFGPN